MDMILNWLQSGLSGLGPLFILLGLLIFVHELGHFMVGKWCGVRVETFSLGFGKKIAQFTKDGTVYCISIIPLGGYVKFFGDDPTKPISEEEQQYSLLHKPVSQRIAILFAGPAMNFLFAGVLFFMIALIGQEVPAPYLGDVEKDSSAYTAGFRSGDQILTVNGKAYNTYKEVEEVVRKAANEELRFEVKRESSGEILIVNATPKLGKNPDVLATTENAGTIEGLGLEAMSPMIGVSDTESPAYKSGLRALDYISKVNGQEVKAYRHLQALFQTAIDQKNDIRLTVASYSEEKEAPERTVTLKVDELKDLDQAEQNLMAALGITSPELHVMRVKPGGPAEQAGLKVGDKIVELDGNPILEWKQVLNGIKGFKIEKGHVDATVIRKGQNVPIQLKPEMTDLLNAKGQDEQRFTVGIYPGMTLAYPQMYLDRTSNIFEAVQVGSEKAVQWTGIVAMGFVKMFQGEVSTRNIGSIVTIGRYASQSFEAGISYFLRMMAIISINLFLINLLPVPVLDGGHLMFYGIEALRGAPLSMKKMEMAQQFGLVVLMSLMAFALFNDIRNWFAAW